MPRDSCVPETMCRLPLSAGRYIERLGFKHRRAARINRNNGLLSIGEISTICIYAYGEIIEVDCPMAFFMPQLVTDANGNAEVDFTVPQFNGTWQFQIMGYTEEMKGGVAVMNAVASKPVMAQMNAPRFVRTGDNVSVAAMLYNNSAEDMSLYGKIEVFDPVKTTLFNDSLDLVPLTRRLRSIPSAP